MSGRKGNDMKEYAEEKAKQDFLDSMKETCECCRKVRIVNQYGVCDDCKDEDWDKDEYYDEHEGTVEIH